MVIWKVKESEKEKECVKMIEFFFGGILHSTPRFDQNKVRFFLFWK
jgi:hypothetical protein